MPFSHVGKMVAVTRLSGRQVKSLLREDEEGRLYVSDVGSRVYVLHVADSSYRQVGLAVDVITKRVTIKEDN